MVAPGEMSSASVLQLGDSIFNEDPAKFTEAPEKFADALYNRLLKESSDVELFPSWNFDDGLEGQLVRVRCMIQDVKGNEFVATSCVIKNADDTTAKMTLLLRNSLGVNENQLVSYDGTASRRVCTMVDVPGSTDWFIAQLESPETNEQPTPAKRSRQPAGYRNDLAPFVAKFIGEEDDDKIKPNTVMDLFGLLVTHETVVDPDYIDDAADSEELMFTATPTLHVLHYETLSPFPGAIKSAPSNSADMHKMDAVLREKLTALMGDSCSADWLASFLSSTTYARPDSGMPICCLPINVYGVTNAGAITSLLQCLLPKVKVLTLTPDLLSEVRFTSKKDYETNSLQQGELQLSDGTVLIIDETLLPATSFPVRDHADENLKVLEKLILEQRMQYDYQFYPLVFDVDVSLLILSKHRSRFLMTPFRIPMIPPMPTSPPLDGVFGNEEEIGQLRVYIQTCRDNLKEISISNETSQKVQGSIVELCKNMAKNMDKADVMNELLILSRLCAARSGSSEVEWSHWERAIKMERDRKEIMHEWLKMNKASAVTAAAPPVAHNVAPGDA